MWFFFPFAATVLGILIENVWKSHSRPPIGRSLTIWEMEQRMILKATSRDQHQKSLHRTLLIKVLNASVGRKTGSESVSHVPSLTFTLLGSPPPRELQNRWPWWSRLFFSQKIFQFMKKVYYEEDSRRLHKVRRSGRYTDTLMSLRTDLITWLLFLVSLWVTVTYF